MTVTLRLTDEQVAEVTRVATDARALDALSAGVGDRNRLVEVIQASYNDRRLSQSLLRAVAVFSAFPDDGSDRDLSSVADEVGLSKSTTHRYITTWVSLRWLEQSPNSRAYRRTGLAVERG
jgi:hypothetical protein